MGEHKVFVIVLQGINLQKLMPGSDICISINLYFVWICIGRYVLLHAHVYMERYKYPYIYIYIFRYVFIYTYLNL